MKPLAMVFIADSGYHGYVPLCAYYCFRSYPDISVFAYLSGKSGPAVKRCMSAAAEMGDLRIKKMEDYADPTGLDVDSMKALRWVLYDPDFEEFECVYVGGTNMIFVRRGE